MALNETLTKLQNYAKVPDAAKSHGDLWTAGIVAVVVILAFFGGVSTAIFFGHYTLKKRVDVQDMNQEIQRKAAANANTETKGLLLPGRTQTSVRGPSNTTQPSRPCQYLSF